MLVLNGRLERLKWQLPDEANEKSPSAETEGVFVVSLRDPARSDSLEASRLLVRSSTGCGTRLRSADKGWQRNETLAGEEVLPKDLAGRDCVGICAQSCSDGEESSLWRPRR